jgi:tRNA U34 2-thiouridine synthase MnmA/TrmU
MFYYLGLEARQRDNVYQSLEEAIKDAKYVAKRLSIPIRVFNMLDNKKSEVIKIIRPQDADRPLGRRIFMEDS